MPAVADYLTTPVGFTLGVLGLKLYPWQEAVLWDLNLPGSVALRCCNGAGKTSVIGAAACLWHAGVYPGSLTVVTSGTFRQVSAQLFPAMHRHAGNFPGATFNETEIALPNGSRIFGFTTDESGRFEGWHSKNLLVLVDEAKTVSDNIFEAVSRCAPTRLLIMSSPGGCSGEFYRAFTARKKFYRCHTVTAAQCPHISPEWIAEQTEKYGADSPLVKSMIHAEFMDAGEGGEIIPLAFLEKLLAEPPAFADNGEVQAGCDFAAGGDSNCLAIRRGNRIEVAACWKEHDTARSIGKFITLFQQHNLTPGSIVADAGGMGCVFCDALAEAGWPVRRFNFGQSATDGEHFTNAGGELWFTARRRIEKREIILPADNELTAQLSTRRGWPNSKGKLELESKGEMRGRGLGSPDKADAVLMSILPDQSGGWNAATLKGVFIGGFESRLGPRMVFTPRFSMSRIL
jgi:hypothetical protein